MTSMLNILNNNRYIELSVLSSCFEKGKITHVDKVYCGNGFSTAFLNSKPPDGMINIMIVPNKQVIISKENSLGKSSGVKYIYEDSEDKSINNASILMFVADSFILNIPKLIPIRDRINWILIDEYHSIEIQSSFRYKLVDFLSRLKYFTEHSSIVTVTATPNLGSPIDVRIENAYSRRAYIHYTNNRIKSIERARNAFHTGKRVFICTNSISTVNQFRTSKYELRAKFMVGESFLRSMTKRFKIIDDEHSNLVIATSRGFEGMDLTDEDYYVFFYENRSSRYETFFISNMYQAINRPRKPPAYVEWCRNELQSERKPLPGAEEVLEFITDKSLSSEQKQSGANKDFRSFVIFKTTNNGDIELIPNTPAIRLQNETVTYDKTIIPFINFVNNRHITLINLKEFNLPMGAIRTATEEKIANLKSNEELIKKHNLYGPKYILQPKSLDTFEKYLAYLKEWQIEKNYDGKRGVIVLEDKIEQALSNKVKVLQDVMRLRAKHNIHAKPDDNVEMFVGELLISLVNKPVTFRPNWVAHRNYNVLTSLSMQEIEYICNLVGVEVTEIDIKNCFPRICYALNNLELPDNFYQQAAKSSDPSKVKKAKVLVQIALNSVWYDKTKSTTRDNQLRAAVKRLEAVNFHEDVIEYLIQTFFEAPFKGDFFNRMAFHERMIMHNIKATLLETGGNDGVERRHDSVIIFNNVAFIGWLNEFEYLGASGWFKVKSGAGL